MKKIVNSLLLAGIVSMAGLSIGSMAASAQATAPQPPKVTLGIGEVTTIESLAASFKTTKDSIAARKLELADLEKALKGKVDKLRTELAELIKDRDDKLRDLKGGFFCSKCGKLKSEFEKQGQSFEKHLDDVTAVAVPAPTTRIEQLREEYKLKIAYKRVQIQNVEKSDPAVNAKRREIAELEKKLESICSEITKHSQSYDKTLAGQTKDKQLAWLRQLMDYASDILIAEDRIVIYEAKIVAVTKEFERDSAARRDEIAKTNSEQRETRKSELAGIERRVQEMDSKFREAIGLAEAKKPDINRRLAEIEAQLKTAGLPADVKQSLIEEKARLESQLAQIETDIRTQTADHASAVETLGQRKRELETVITRLIADLPKEQDAEVAKLKGAADIQKTAMRKILANANVDLAKARTLYKEREAYYSKENTAFYDVVAGESNRIVLAARDISCPVGNDARQFVASNWNKLLPCVSAATTRAKPYSTNVFGSYCPKEVAASSFGKYKSFLKGLGPDEIAAVKANSNVGWYEALFPATL